MRIRRPAAMLAAALATATLVALPAPGSAAADPVPSGRAYTHTDVGHAPVAEHGLRTAASSYSWGERETDRLGSCLDVPSSLGASSRVGQYFEDGRTPQVGDIFYAVVEVGWVGSACRSATAVQTEWVPPLGTTLYADDDHPPVACTYRVDENGSTSTPDCDKPVWISNPGPHGGTLVQSTRTNDRGQLEPDVWQLQRSGTNAVNVFIPVRVERPLKGIATPPPSCRERVQGLGPCARAESGDHLQVGVRTAHNASWLSPYVGLFAGGKATPRGTAKPVGRITSKKPGKLAVSVRSEGQRPTGRITVRSGSKVVGTATLASKDKGSRTVTLKRLAKGKRTLTVTYGGSSATKPVTWKVKVTVR